MKRAYPWLLRNTTAGFITFLVLQIVIVGGGLRLALVSYAGYQLNQFEEIARSILVNPRVDLPEALSYSNPFFVFSADKNLLFSNRGKGRAIPEDDYVPVRYDGATIGYYYAGELRFLDSAANRLFLSSLAILAAISVVVSLGVGMVVSFLAAKRIANPVVAITNDIESIQGLKRIRAKRFAIAELSELSSALERLSTILANEEAYKRQWMQDIAHDLRTPISGLRGQLEGMRDGVLPATLERLERNLNEISRLENLVNGIADLQNAESKGTLKDILTVRLISVYEIPNNREKRQQERCNGRESILHAARQRTMLLS